MIGQSKGTNVMLLIVPSIRSSRITVKLIRDHSKHRFSNLQNVG